MELKNSEIKFIKTYHKKNYGKEQNIVADEFDINLNQTNKRNINKVNQEKGTNHKYSFMKNKHRIEDMKGQEIREGFLKHFFNPINQAEELILKVNEVNNYEDKLV